jgi:TatD DNase family protein
MLADAHVHLADLLERDPAYPGRLAGREWTCCAASHSEEEWTATQALRGRLPVFVSSFGMHPQWAVWGHADFLARLASAGDIAAIGEAGFDFYGDRPERVRNPENEIAQRAVFEYQLELAERCGLALLLHLRKATDLAFEYAPRLKRLRAAVFHSFPGSGDDARSLLTKGVNAYFSFGAPVVNGNKRAQAACASIPADRILSETDAPWQPPRRPEGRPLGEARKGAADWCRPEDLEMIVDGISALRDTDRPSIERALARNFAAAFGLPAPELPG